MRSIEKSCPDFHTAVRDGDVRGLGVRDGEWFSKRIDELDSKRHRWPVASSETLLIVIIDCTVL